LKCDYPSENQNYFTLYTNIQLVPHREWSGSVREVSRLIVYNVILAIYCDDHTEHINALWDKGLETVMLNFTLNLATSEL